MDHDNHEVQVSSGSNPCTDKLTDREYLDHMIPHHQVAIDMSNMLEPNTNSDTMLNLCREIKRKQSYEIWEMSGMKNYKGDLFSDAHWTKDTIVTKLDMYNPIMSKSKDGSCNPLFFKPHKITKNHKKSQKFTKTTKKIILNKTLQLTNYNGCKKSSKRYRVPTTN